MEKQRASVKKVLLIIIIILLTIFMLASCNKKDDVIKPKQATQYVKSDFEVCLTFEHSTIGSDWHNKNLRYLLGDEPYVCKIGEKFECDLYKSKLRPSSTFGLNCYFTVTGTINGEPVNEEVLLYFKNDEAMQEFNSSFNIDVILNDNDIRRTNGWQGDSSQYTSNAQHVKFTVYNW